ncbi:unnamed protein product [Ceratitis capitata]|uniref:(Mediterranean fruit fly) hypothetical protein n=1 Tax=Ceratitis capitata TaxID=7213 RepID=A0A811UNG4_CERCA|nr:unnamed protein product [Ceratitis capitata]
MNNETRSKEDHRNEKGQMPQMPKQKSPPKTYYMLGPRSAAAAAAMKRSQHLMPYIVSQLTMGKRILRNTIAHEIFRCVHKPKCLQSTSLRNMMAMAHRELPKFFFLYKCKSI